MKKRLLTLFLLLALLLPAAGLCAGPVMKVVNCEEWVSLRQNPSPYAKRLMRIPLGALVTDCRYANSEYTACVYAGRSGYVMSDYLEYTNETPAPTPIPTPSPVPSATPIGYPDRSGVWGRTIDKLSTRSGPGTEYDDMGTYNVKGQWVRVYCRAWDARHSIWWVKVGIPYHGETRKLWTGYKRFDSSTLPLSSIPIGH